MKSLLYCLIIFLVFSCKAEKPKDKKVVSTEDLIMYTPSEMALLMEKMFVENEKLKQKIERGEVIGEFNQEYLNIHSAILTDPNDRNDTFESFAKALILNQQSIFEVETVEVKNQFNKMVQTCVSCHETTCTGPIPRIKKLIIK